MLLPLWTNTSQILPKIRKPFSNLCLLVIFRRLFEVAGAPAARPAARERRELRDDVEVSHGHAANLRFARSPVSSFLLRFRFFRDTSSSRKTIKEDREGSEDLESWQEG